MSRLTRFAHWFNTWGKTLFLNNYKLVKYFRVTYKNKKHIIPLLHAENFVNSLDIGEGSCILASVSPFKFIFRKDHINNAIYCNNMFLSEYPECEKLAFIYHELGHILLGHLEPHIRKYTNDEQRELEADQFAIRNGHGKNLLSGMLRYSPTQFEYEMDDLSKKRVKALKACAYEVNL